jgi:hypothetical protein
LIDRVETNGGDRTGQGGARGAKKIKRTANGLVLELMAERPTLSLDR